MCDNNMCKIISYVLDSSTNIYWKIICIHEDLQISSICDAVLFLWSLDLPNTDQDTGLVFEIFASFPWSLPGLKLYIDCPLKHLFYILFVGRVGSGGNRCRLGGAILESNCVSIL